MVKLFSFIIVLEIRMIKDRSTSVLQKFWNFFVIVPLPCLIFERQSQSDFSTFVMIQFFVCPIVILQKNNLIHDTILRFSFFDKMIYNHLRFISLNFMLNKITLRLIFS